MTGSLTAPLGDAQPASTEASANPPTSNQTTRQGLQNLPPELLLLVAQSLPVSSRLILSQTCSALHATIQTNRSTQCSSKDLSLLAQAKYLSVIARDFPDRWVCDHCVMLHPVDHQDTPQHPAVKSCRRANSHFLNAWELSWPHHRHVQLALKYARLGVQVPEQRRYLADLLEPVFGSHPPDARDAWIAHVKYAARARIVDGRYLLKYTWHYNVKAEPIELLSQGSEAQIVICSHQGVSGYMMAKIFQRGEEEPGIWETGETGEPVVEAVTRESLLGDPRGMELAESCPYCPTDFSIFLGRTDVWFSAWYDLGREGSPFDWAWTGHDVNVRYGYVGRSIHMPGSIRCRYQHAARRDTAGRGW